MTCMLIARNPVVFFYIRTIYMFLYGFEQDLSVAINCKATQEIPFIFHNKQPQTCTGNDV